MQRGHELELDAVVARLLEVGGLQWGPALSPADPDADAVEAIHRALPPDLARFLLHHARGRIAWVFMTPIAVGIPECRTEGSGAPFYVVAHIGAPALGGYRQLRYYPTRREYVKCESSETSQGPYRPVATWRAGFVEALRAHLVECEAGRHQLDPGVPYPAVQPAGGADAWDTEYWFG